jgi:hypothetical protein
MFQKDINKAKYVHIVPFKCMKQFISSVLNLYAENI